MRNKDRLAVLGAGHVGPVIARLAIAAGHPVAIATSGDPDDIALITELVIPGGRPRWASRAIADADLVVLAIPLHRFAELDPGRLAGKIVVDAMNYWPASDGVLTAFEDGGTNSRGSSEIVARRLAGSAVVKALNHIGYHDLEDRARPAGAPDRRATGLAGEDRKSTRLNSSHSQNSNAVFCLKKKKKHYQTATLRTTAPRHTTTYRQPSRV